MEREEQEKPSLTQNSSNEYTLDEKSVWITVKGMSVYITKTDEGVAVDIFALGHEDDSTGSLGSTYVFDSEVEELEEQEGSK